MGFLATLLPGLRELRAPLASGLLWLGVLILSVPANLSSASTDALARLNGDLFGIASPTIAVGAAFLLGILAQSLVTPLINRVGLWARRLVRRIEDRENYYRLNGITLTQIDLDKVTIPDEVQTVSRKPQRFYRFLRDRKSVV